MMRALDGITADGLGDAASPRAARDLEPYQTEHINRFGDHVLDMSKPPVLLPFMLPQLQQEACQTTETVHV